MSFLIRHCGLAVCVFLLCTATGCDRREHAAEKNLRREVRQALREESYSRATELAQRALVLNPHDDDSWENLARAQIGANELAAARATLLGWRAAVRKPSPGFDERSGDLALREGDAANAFDSWTRALQANPKNLELLEKIARAHHQLRQPAEEDAALSAILELQDDPGARMNRALCRRQMLRWSQAMDDYRRASQSAPDDPEVHRGAKLFERLEKLLPEIRELDARLAMTPDDDSLLADRALLFLRAEDDELALRDAEAAAKTATAMRPKLFYALALLALGRAPEAAALKVDPHLRLENLTPEFLETVSRLDSEISLEPESADLHLTRAWQLNEIGQPLLALEDAESALRADSKSSGAHAEFAYALSKLGRAEEAFAQIKTATEIDPNFSAAWSYRGELEMARKDFAAAIDSFTHALASTQTIPLLEKREQCYVLTNQPQKAEADRHVIETLKARF